MFPLSYHPHNFFHPQIIATVREPRYTEATFSLCVDIPTVPYDPTHFQGEWTETVSLLSCYYSVHVTSSPARIEGTRVESDVLDWGAIVS